ncbi:lyase family protein [Mycobacterium sp. pUA109]|uniref:lyase family protein n=1 Tax=Mycobacterium sp. pUA109 TaxID=3238982 RepID=UPI00351BD10E
MNLLWPGDQRAGALMTDDALLAAMLAVESAWLTALADAGVAPAACAGADLAGLVGLRDTEALAAAAEDGGNPVIGVVAVLRERAGSPISEWLHRGLTSQDVLDTALMLATRSVVDLVATQLVQQISVLSTLTATHRGTPMLARTLTQPAVPTTFGAKAAGWLRGLLDAHQQLTALVTPIQIGGAAGTWSAITELVTLTESSGDPSQAAARLVRAAATGLGLATRPPWHTTRTPVTAAGDALLGCTDAWGRIAADVVVLARPEIGELGEPSGAGRGGSSTMPDKHNPVLSILIRRAAIAAPPLAATLHTAAALANDERPDGAWHAEWDTLRTLARRTVVAGSQCSELLAGLQIHPAAMARNLAAVDVGGEQRAIANLVGKPPSPNYFGAIDLLVDETLERARRTLTRVR